ncbi:TetR/AcrR family transcriptional regulator [Parasedimentitalea psychrophila]|uniref:TetR/AcrR family transcriptional regulator n=1 Tax=Parasedimentitalea psychrophila TaxID=2997337 RepID=A0A9Y2L091_9RHOB|nr:TetR/AcrR family transcriptional regulator [Parasedimentitalea psychrophila]WIY24454.1 TetR/AcrR family transcriptional regulator [Parasedimentitalea psychrophila]
MGHHSSNALIFGGTMSREKIAQNNGKKPRTASKEVRRQQLIDATIDSIAKHGIVGTTMTTVTRTAGLSIGLANFHFSTKQNLFEETLRFLAEEHHQQWKKSYEKANLAPEDKLLAIVAAHFHPKICNRKKIAVWYSFFGEAGGRASYRKLADDIDTERRDISTELCRKIIEDGGYDTVDATDVTLMLESIYDGFWLNILMYPGEFSLADAKRRIEGYLSQVFPRHFQRPAPPDSTG